MCERLLTADRLIEELRAELRGTNDIEEARQIEAELAPLLKMREMLMQEQDAP